MYLFKLAAYLSGYVVLLVTGEAPEKFVNMAASRGIYLWEVTRIGEGAILMKVRVSSVKPLRHIARRTGCRFKIRARRGVPFMVTSLRRRKSMALGLALFLTGLYLLSSMVWFIDIKGNQRLAEAEILGAAAEAGLKKGVMKWQVNTAAVEARIEEKLPLVSWTGVYIKGTRVTIEVAERIVPAEEDRRPAHIVAGKAGLIKEVLILTGHPAVKEGDTVVPGQVLISGAIPPPEEPNKPGEEKKPEKGPKIIKPLRYVQARGIVRARVWYEGYGEAEITETGRRLTGRSETRLSMKFSGKEIILAGSQKIPYKLYESETFVKRAPQWRNINIPVELVTVKYLEMQEYREDRGRGGARRAAEEKALEAINRQLPKDARIQERRLEEVVTGQPENLVRVKAVVETIEDIGVERHFKPEDKQ